MYRFAQVTMIVGFAIMVAVGLWQGFGNFPFVYAGLVLLTGAFALWGLKKIER